MTDDEAAAHLDTLDAAAARHATPCGEGTMAWRVWGAAQPGRPLVLLHGGSGSWRHWVRNIPAWAATRPVLCADLPGLGDSALPPRGADPAGIGAIVGAGIAAVLGPGTRFDLCGFSYGALLAGEIAARGGAECASLTLLGAGALGLPRPPVALLGVRDKQGEARVAAHRQNLEALMVADPAAVDPLALALQEANVSRARFVSRSFAATTLLRDAVAAASAPVALIYGEFDAIAHPEIAARFATLRAVRPDAWCGMVPGVGHWVAYEAAATINAMLPELLARRRSPP